jgi:hypothetical protein
MSVHLLDIEWLLSTLFDASLLKLRAAGNGGSFFRFVLLLARKRSAFAGTGQFPRPSAHPRIPAALGNYVGSFAAPALDRRSFTERLFPLLARGWRIVNATDFQPRRGWRKKQKVGVE